LRDAATLSLARKVIVLVDSTQIHLATPLLPNKRGAQAEQLLRYALEDQLATDVDTLHFAKGKRAASGATPVAAVARAALEAWLDALAGASIEPNALYADADVLPAGGMTLAVDNGLLYLRRGEEQGVVVDAQPLEQALALALGTEDSVAEPALVYVPQAEYEAHAPTLDGLRERFPALQVKLLAEGPLPLFAVQAVKETAVNLLSGPYARKKSFNAQFAPWRVAAVLAGAAIALHVGASAVQYIKLSRLERQTDTQIREVFQQTLPGTALNDVRQAKQIFQSRLGVQTGGGGELLRALDVLAATVAEGGTRVDAVAFRTDTLDLRLTVPSVDDLARIQQTASESGLRGEIQSATPRDNKTEGRLQFKLGKERA
jgi:general secretion pathway protein L